MTARKDDDLLIKAMVLEDRIIDYKVASMRVHHSHWLSQYYERRMQEKIAEWERVTGRKYTNGN